jgi:raffinose synthase
MPRSSTTRKNPITGKTIIRFRGKARVEIFRFIVNPMRSQGEVYIWLHRLGIKPLESGFKSPQTSQGRDPLGAFRQNRFNAQEGDIAGSLFLNQYNSDGPATLAVEASCINPLRTWWAFQFGLAGEGTVVLRLNLPGFSRGLGFFMNDEWWLQPQFPRKPSELFQFTRQFVWQEKDGLYGCLLPLCGGDATSYLKGVPGGLELRVSTFQDGLAKAQAPVLLVSFGQDPYELVQKAHESALKFLGMTAKPRTAKKFPEPLQYLGWCTWDSFYRDVNAKGILRQLQDFKRKGIPIRTVIIDDGWYKMKDNMMQENRADKARFPQGLSKLIRRMKREYPVRFVGLWHALTGYWFGVHPKNKLDGAMKKELLHTKGWPPAPPLERDRAARFWGHWHGWMKAQGADFVKVDGQGGNLRYSRNLMPVSHACANVQNALQDSVNRHFQGNIINCMSMGPEQMWNWSSSNVTRSSDDYMMFSKESDTWRHSRLNAYNSFSLSPITWCDWDMFWSASPNADFHQALRAISGGPVYISDKVGAAQADKLLPFVLPDGRLLRCDEVGVPTLDSLFSDPNKGRALKVMNRAKEAGVIALFHAAPKRGNVQAAFKPSDIRGLGKGTYAAWNFHEKTGRLMKFDEEWKLSLAPAQARLFIVQPVCQGFAPIGIVDKLIAPKTIEGWKREGNGFRVSLEQGGTFAAYSETLPVSVKAGGNNLNFEYQNGWLSVKVPSTDQVDITVELIKPTKTKN